MSKRLIIVLALAFVVGISFAAYAEVQNVKVSGDITMSGVARNNFDLQKTPSLDAGFFGPSQLNASTYDDDEKDLFTITRVRVDADLTDNVAVTVRLLNERNWNGDSITGLAENNRNIGLAAANGANRESQIDIDLAYVTLKEFLYSPLTITAGRQELHFGNDFIMGDPDTNMIALKSNLAEGDLSSRKAFDAIRATLDYNPLVVDLIYAKIAEEVTTINDDTTLTGVNLKYDLDKSTAIEGYFFSKIRGNSATAATNLDGVDAITVGGAVIPVWAQDKKKSEKIFTLGSRLVNKTVKNLTLDLQGAWQFGSYNPKFDPNARYDGAIPTTGVDEGNAHAAKAAERSAWATEVFAMYDLKDISMISKYKPSVAAGYIYLSGDSRDRVGQKTYHGWDPMFENQTFGHVLNSIMGFSNMNGYIITLQAKPIEDINVKFDYVSAWFNKRYAEGRLAILSGVSGARQFRMGNKKYIGQEFDLTMTYDYTEDVQFSLLGGMFFAGKSINKGNEISTGGTGANPSHQRATATEVIGSMKVTF